MAPSDLVLNKYRLGERIAVGGMGELHLAKSTEGKTAVIKALLPHLATDPQMVAQFLDEARLASKLRHPNLVHVFEFGQWGSTWVLAMEFIDGFDAGQVLRRSSRQGLAIPWQVAVSICSDAAMGLQFAHELSDGGKKLNLIHRDVSPQNILVGRDGRSRVLDFGIADSVDKSTRTATGVVKGKLAYMAPEQARSEDLTAAVDQFALGLVLWELLTGKRAFDANNDVMLLKLAIAGEVGKPSAVMPSVPANVEAVVLRMLKPLAAERYANCRDVHLALRGLLSGDPHETVRGFVAQLKNEEMQLPEGFLLKRTPKSNEVNETPASGNSGASMNTPLIPTPSPPRGFSELTPRTPKSGPGGTATPAKPGTPPAGSLKTPHLDQYLAGLPNGFESYPQMQQKGSIVHSFLDGVPIHQHLAGLPAPVAELARRPPPPSAWISEVQAFGLFLACADLCFPNSDAWVEFAYRANKKIIEGPLYAMLFRMLGVKRIVKVVAGRWDQFHRGTSLSVVKFDEHEGLLRLEGPPNGTPLVVAQAHGTAVRATVEIVGAKNVSVKCTASSPTTFDYVCTWTD
ncbi:MAG: protein kinase [Archangium sp.]|nr:protein kinase [Archangium sp.]